MPAQSLGPARPAKFSLRGAVFLPLTVRSGARPTEWKQSFQLMRPEGLSVNMRLACS